MELEKYMDEKIQGFKNFMRSKDFPKFQISFEENNFSTDENSDDVIARATSGFDPESSALVNHSLNVSTSILSEQERGDYIIYHELAHIWDTEKYGETKAACINSSGYSGFHAGQVDLLKLVGAEHEDEPVEFKMETTFEVFANNTWTLRSVKEYLEDSYNQALHAFKELEVQKLDSSSLIAEMEKLFNFLGRQSVCEEYVVGYDGYYKKKHVVNFCMKPFEEVLSHDECNPVRSWDSLLSFHMDEAQIIKVNEVYGETIEYLAEKHTCSCNICMD